MLMLLKVKGVLLSATRVAPGGATREPPGSRSDTKRAATRYGYF
jgi:hypothetical protein